MQASDQEQKPSTATRSKPESPAKESKEGPKGYRTNRTGEILRHNGVPLIDFNSDGLAFAGAIPGSVPVNGVDKFGESGEVFDHRSWRIVFAVLWSYATAKKCLLHIAGMFLLRGKSLKVEHKGAAKNFPIQLGEIPNDEHKRILGITTSVFYLKICFPRSTDNISALALTPERLKCMLRVVVTPDLIEAERFPATSESLGYAEMVRSFIVYNKNIMKWSPADKEDSEDYKMWFPFMSNAKFLPKMSIQAMTAGTFSSKEIYKEDEDLYPGCIWWSGIHALMTDVANKLRAPSAPTDTRARLEASNFYGDFKRKLAARGLTEAFSPEYYNFLESMQPIIPKFIRLGSGLTEREANVISEVLKLSVSTKKEIRPAGQDDTQKISLEIKPVGGSLFANIQQQHADSMIALAQGKIGK